jgi:hypothetical protein
VKRWLQMTALAALVLGAVVLYRVPPVEGSFYPPCVFHELTGFHCPGCGATRCLHALLHGELRQAVAYNLMLVVFLPFLMLHGARVGHALLAGSQICSRWMPAWAIRGLFVLIVAFWIVRNIPLYPFLLLAPHELAASLP